MHQNMLPMHTIYRQKIQYDTVSPCFDMQN